LEVVRAATGYAAGGTPPIGHANPIRVFADAALRRHQLVWAAGGTPTAFGTLSPRAVTQRWPQVLPGGAAVLYTEHSDRTGFSAANIVVAPVPADPSAKAGPAKVIVRGAYYGRYVPSGLASPTRGERARGHLLYIRQAGVGRRATVGGYIRLDNQWGHRGDAGSLRG
jgi:hypothetical protein